MHKRYDYQEILSKEIVCMLVQWHDSACVCGVLPKQHQKSNDNKKTFQTVFLLENTTRTRSHSKSKWLQSKPGYPCITSTLLVKQNICRATLQKQDTENIYTVSTTYLCTFCNITDFILVWRDLEFGLNFSSGSGSV